jgi:nucleotide-binding universal stress UspA family protein
MGGTLVCDVTDPREGRNAAALAKAVSARLGLRIVLAFVLDGIAAAAGESVTGRQLRRGAERTVSELANQIGNDVDARVVLGDRAEALAWIAAEEGADLVIVGSRAAGLGGRHLRCRLVRDLEAATPVPVLVAPPSTRKRSERRLAVAAAAETH